MGEMHLESNIIALKKWVRCILNLIRMHWKLGVSALKIECNVLKY